MKVTKALIKRLQMSAVAWDDTGAIHRPALDICGVCLKGWPCATAQLQVSWLNAIKVNRSAILATLDAAYKYAEAYEEQTNMSPVTRAVWKKLADAQSHLLATISLEGQEVEDRSACEKCWADAFVRSRSHPSKSQVEHYVDLLDERKGQPCSPEEQKGERP